MEASANMKSFSQQFEPPNGDCPLAVICRRDSDRRRSVNYGSSAGMSASIWNLKPLEFSYIYPPKNGTLFLSSECFVLFLLPGFPEVSDMVLLQ